MREYICLAPTYVFGDYMAKCSPQAVLYYIKLLCNANKGFVADALGLLDSLGYDKSVYNELVASECILAQPNRSEIFITAFYIHNRAFKYNETFKSYFWTYWKGKIWFKENGMATRKIQESAIYDPNYKRLKDQPLEDKSFDDLVSEIANDDNEEIGEKI